MKEEKTKKEKRISTPRKMTPAVRASLINSIKIGLTQLEAAENAGIDESTFYRWQKKALESNGTGAYASLFQDLKKATTESKLYALGIVSKAANNKDFTEETKTTYDAKGNIKEKVVIRKPAGKSWQAAAWFLERKFREEFGRNAVDAQQEPIKIEVSYPDA